jgi:HsdM N-terminal domain
MTAETHHELANFIWSICNLLRGPYKRNEYRKVILPLTVLRRFDCLLADPELRDTESVPLKESIAEYFKREVLPHVPDGWIDESKTKVGYEIPLNRHFYVYEPPRPLEVIEADIKTLEGEILALLKEVTA